VHEYGTLSHFVRASMTVVGLLPPVYNDGDLLVDGGYLNNIPVDVMRSQMGVDTLIVVDVEDKDFCTWKDLDPYESGLSGFYLLWQSLKSVVSRKPFRYPRYGEMISSLLFLSHKQQIRATMRDFHVDLYMQPTGVQFYRLMDYHLMDRIVRDAYRYGWQCLVEWQTNSASRGGGEGGKKEVMKLRTRSISKVHSDDFVRSINKSSGRAPASAVERIQTALAERGGGGAGGAGAGASAGGHGSFPGGHGGGARSSSGRANGGGGGGGEGGAPERVLHAHGNGNGHAHSDGHGEDEARANGGTNVSWANGGDMDLANMPTAPILQRRAKSFSVLNKA